MLIYIVLHSTKFEQKATPEVKSRVHLAVIVAVILAVNSLFDITLLHSVAMPVAPLRRFTLCCGSIRTIRQLHRSVYYVHSDGSHFAVELNIT